MILNRLKWFGGLALRFGLGLSSVWDASSRTEPFWAKLVPKLLKDYLVLICLTSLGVGLVGV